MKIRWRRHCWKFAGRRSTLSPVCSPLFSFNGWSGGNVVSRLAAPRSLRYSPATCSRPRRLVRGLSSLPTGMFRVLTRINVSNVSTEMFGRLGRLSVRRARLLRPFTLFCLSDILSELHWSCFERRPFLRVCGLECVPLSGPVFRL